MTHPPDPASLQKRAFQGLAQFLGALAIMLFLPAWSLRYWQGWIFWGEFSALVIWITLYFLKKDPALIERRLKAGPGAEKEKIQKVIQTFASLCFIALIISSAFDYRFGWSRIPRYLVGTGDVLVALGLVIVFLVFRENSYTSGIIEIGWNQTVISTGPYRVVRHPMYAGALLMLIGVPWALGSWWGLCFCVPLTGLIVWRLTNEEKYLLANLAGYDQYCSRTTYRLVPRIY